MELDFSSTTMYQRHKSGESGRMSKLDAGECVKQIQEDEAKADWQRIEKQRSSKNISFQTSQLRDKMSENKNIL